MRYLTLLLLYSIQPYLGLAQLVDTTRAVKLEGAINFRDIGNYVTVSGKKVKKGLLFRSADLSKLTNDDQKILEKLHIQYDFDFRGPYEVKSAPDKIPSTIERISLPAGSETIGDSNYMRDMVKKIKDSAFILSFYNNISSFKERYQPLFDSLLSFKSEKALVFHCTAGKDRTGIAAALILYSLGVDEQTILNDYELTNFYRREENEKTIAQMQKFYGMSYSNASALMAANREYLKSTFNTIKNQYGSLDYYLEKVMGLDNNKIFILRSYYTR